MMREDPHSNRMLDLRRTYTTFTCSSTGLVWIRIYATRKIKAGEEIFIDYGEDFWRKTGSYDAAAATARPNKPAKSAVQESSQENSTSIWAAPAPMPDTTPSQISLDTNDHHIQCPADDVSTAYRQTETETWANQAIAPAIPMIIGHHSSTNPLHTPSPIHFPISISPIKTQTSSTRHTHMNEIYSFTQQYNLDNTILLPVRISNPMNVSKTL